MIWWWPNKESRNM